MEIEDKLALLRVKSLSGSPSEDTDNSTYSSELFVDEYANPAEDQNEFFDESDYDYEFNDDDYTLDMYPEDDYSEETPSGEDLNTREDIIAFKKYMLEKKGIDIGDANISFSNYPQLEDMLADFLQDDEAVSKIVEHLRKQKTNQASGSQIAPSDTISAIDDRKSTTFSKVLDASTGGYLGFLTAADITGAKADIGFNTAIDGSFIAKEISRNNIPSKIALLYVIKRITFHLEGLGLNSEEDSIAGFRNKFYPKEYKAINDLRAHYSDVLNLRYSIRKKTPNLEFSPMAYSDRYVEMYNRIALSVHDTILSQISKVIMADKLPYYMSPSEIKLLQAITAVWYLAPANITSYVKKNGALALAAGFGSGNSDNTIKIANDLLDYHHSYLKSLSNKKQYAKTWDGRIAFLKS